MGTLSPEEKQQIYEEEKARMEAQDRLKLEAKKKKHAGSKSLLFLVFVGVLVWIFWPQAPQVVPGQAGPVTPATPPAAQLRIVDQRGELGDYYNQIDGRVQNITQTSLQNVDVVVTWFDSGGNFISTSSALVDFNPLLPGQTSPFKVMTRTNPAMKRFMVEFKSLLGGTIPHETLPDKKQPRSSARPVNDSPVSGAVSVHDVSVPVPVQATYDIDGLEPTMVRLKAEGVSLGEFYLSVPPKYKWKPLGLGGRCWTQPHPAGKDDERMCVDISENEATISVTTVEK